MNLELYALRWLRFQKHCPVALFERSPRMHLNGQPDVMGVTQARYIYEIEIKRTLSDFRANKEKNFHRGRDLGMHRPHHPKLFWFLVPEAISQRIRQELPPWSGLITCDGHGRLIELIPSPVNKESRRLSALECIRLAHMMANQIFSMANTLSNWEGLRYEGWIDDYSI